MIRIHWTKTKERETASKASRQMRPLRQRIPFSSAAAKGQPPKQAVVSMSHLPDANVDEEEEPLDREAARHNYFGPGGDELLSKMEDEFVAKSGALVGRMTVAAAQVNEAFG